ncbi:MAG: phosphonate degradation HD-domain oxygenase [Planctomycetota bacterium]
MGIAQEIVELFSLRGDSEYGGEPVTQLEHALQCAELADREKSTDALVVAALLHDIGHLLHDLPIDAPDQGIDDKHEKSGFYYLQKNFPAEVFEPVRLHVAAKRYLCAVDDAYFSLLSQPSVVSLELQGGKMSQQECQAFEGNPHYNAAVRLRRWDDTAKDPEARPPAISSYVERIERVGLK